MDELEKKTREILLEMKRGSYDEVMKRLKKSLGDKFKEGESNQVLDKLHAANWIKGNEDVFSLSYETKKAERIKNGK